MNSDFWVAIATAAPVVVLTCIVLCSTQGVIWRNCSMNGRQSVTRLSSRQLLLLRS